MFESINRRPRRRTVTVGVTTAAVVAAAGGAFFASQAGAATVPAAYIMLKVPSQTACALVTDVTPQRTVRNSTILEYGDGTGHNASSWNGTGIVAPVGDHIAVGIGLGNACVSGRYRVGEQYKGPTPYQVVSQAYGDFWIDAS